jgi:hypothetical protein
MPPCFRQAHPAEPCTDVLYTVHAECKRRCILASDFITTPVSLSLLVRPKLESVCVILNSVTCIYANKVERIHRKFAVVCCRPNRFLPRARYNALNSV